MAYQSTSTSLVLKNPDLLQIIFEFFDLCNLECIMSIHSSWIQRRTRQSLLWAALTSKAFLEPAMNALWYEMDSILPLYLVLPALRKELQGDLDKENQGSESECTLPEPLNRDDVQRMVFYARRIRSLHFHCKGDKHFNIHLDLAMAFFTRINQLNAFLSLRKLIVGSDLIKFQHTTLRTISPPNLEHLALRQDGPYFEESRVNSFLKALTCKSHHIKTLVVEGDYTGLNFSVLSKFSRVQSLTIYFRYLPVISLSFLEQIASSMTSLQSLEMDLDSSQFKNDLKNSSRHVFQFMSLTNLVIDGHFHSVGKVLEVVHAPLLCRLSLSVNSLGPGFDPCTSIRSFIPVKMMDKIQSFSVHQCFDAGPIDFDSRISPFITFEQLEEFSVRVQTLRISTTHLAVFLKNNRYLSNLQRLTLEYGRPSEINQSLSIAALPLIANTCPKLLYLAISVYHPDQSEMRITTRSGRSHKLQTLIFDSIPDWDDSTSLATALSSFLDHQFPELTNAQLSYWAVPESRLKWWKGVQDMIKAHRTRRVRNESD